MIVSKRLKDSSEPPVYHTGEGGATPTQPLHFSNCTLSTVSAFIKQHHYSHTHPGGIDFPFGCWLGEQLVGALVYGHIAGNPASAIVTANNKPMNYRELMRLVLLDWVPRNSESRFIGWTLRYLRANTDLIGVVSFADPKYGHTGIVYRASNWKYLGLQKPCRPRLFVNGVDVHPKSCYNRWGTSSVPKLRALGLDVVEGFREPKHKYAFSLRKEWPLL